MLFSSLLLNRLRAAKGDAIVLTVVGVMIVISSGMTIARFILNREARSKKNLYGALALCAAGTGAEGFHRLARVRRLISASVIADFIHSATSRTVDRDSVSPVSLASALLRPFMESAWKTLSVKGPVRFYVPPGRKVATAYPPTTR